MAVFTSAQAKAVIVKSAEKTFYPDSGSFKEWIFVVEDGKGNVYEWVETSALLGFTPSSSARVLTPSQIGNYIHAYLSGGLNAAGSASYTGVTKLSSDLESKVGSTADYKDIPERLMANNLFQATAAAAKAIDLPNAADDEEITYESLIAEDGDDGNSANWD